MILHRVLKTEGVKGYVIFVNSCLECIENQMT